MSTNPTIHPNVPTEYAIHSGEELTYVLKAAGYSQRELADFMDKSRSHINDVCNGRSTFTLRHQQAVIKMLTDVTPASWPNRVSASALTGVIACT